MRGACLGGVPDHRSHSQPAVCPGLDGAEPFAVTTAEGDTVRFNIADPSGHACFKDELSGVRSVLRHYASAALSDEGLTPVDRTDEAPSSCFEQWFMTNETTATPAAAAPARCHGIAVGDRVCRRGARRMDRAQRRAVEQARAADVPQLCEMLRAQGLPAEPDGRTQVQLAAEVVEAIRATAAPLALRVSSRTGAVGIPERVVLVNRSGKVHLASQLEIVSAFAPGTTVGVRSLCDCRGRCPAAEPLGTAAVVAAARTLPPAVRLLWRFLWHRRAWQLRAHRESPEYRMHAVQGRMRGANAYGDLVFSRAVVTAFVDPAAVASVAGGGRRMTVDAAACAGALIDAVCFAALAAATPQPVRGRSQRGMIVGRQIPLHEGFAALPLPGLAQWLAARTTLPCAAAAEGRPTSRVCDLCLEPVPDEDETMWCCRSMHWVCKGCICSHVQASIGSRQVICPLHDPTAAAGTSCSCAITPQAMRRMVPHSLISQFEEAAKGATGIECSICSAEQPLNKSGLLLAARGEAPCHACSAIICTNCGEQHGGKRCPSRPPDSLWNRLLARVWLECNTVQCTQCHARIERNGGCPHMTCRCGHCMCWDCGRDYFIPGTRHYHTSPRSCREAIMHGCGSRCQMAFLLLIVALGGMVGLFVLPALFGIATGVGGSLNSAIPGFGRRFAVALAAGGLPATNASTCFQPSDFTSPPAVALDHVASAAIIWYCLWRPVLAVASYAFRNTVRFGHAAIALMSSLRSWKGRDETPWAAIRVAQVVTMAMALRVIGAIRFSRTAAFVFNAAEPDPVALARSEAFFADASIGLQLHAAVLAIKIVYREYDRRSGRNRSTRFAAVHQGIESNDRWF